MHVFPRPLTTWLRRIRRVSKVWQSVIEALPHLWHDLDLSSASGKKAVSIKFISTCIRCSRGTIRSGTLKSFPDQAPLNNIFYLACRFSQLQYLYCVDNSIKYKASSLLAESKMISNLTTIILGKEATVSVESLIKILDNHESLTTAEFHNIRGRFSSNSQGLTKVYPRLRSLLLGHASVGSELTLDVVSAYLAPLRPVNNIILARFHT